MNLERLSIIALCLVAIAGGILLVNRNRGDDPPAPTVSNETGEAKISNREDARYPAESRLEREAREERERLAKVERDKLTALWLKKASSGFEQTRKHLVTDLGLDAAQNEELAKIFTRREKELGILLAASGETEDDRENFKQICAIIRNKGLREDLAGVLSGPQLAAFDEMEEKRERETVEARAYRDMSEINAVVQLTESQKQEVLGVLTEHAPQKVEMEADARAYLSLHYGPLANEMLSSSFRGLTNMISGDMMAGRANLDIDSAEYSKLAEAKKAERIEDELSTLRDVLDEEQLARYREHLETGIPW